MKQSRIQTLNLRRKSVTKDNEGVPIVSYGSLTPIEAETWPAGGELQAQTYGDKVNRMINVRIKGAYEIIIEDDHEAYKYDTFTLCEGDGLCIHRTDKPDYRIISIKPYKPLRLEAEKI